MDTPASADQQSLTYISFVRTLDAVKRNCQELKAFNICGDGESKESMLSAQLDVDDNIYTVFNMYMLYALTLKLSWRLLVVVHEKA